MVCLCEFISGMTQHGDAVRSTLLSSCWVQPPLQGCSMTTVRFRASGGSEKPSPGSLLTNIRSFQSPTPPRSISTRPLLPQRLQRYARPGIPFGLESTLSGTTHAKLLQQPKSPGYPIELHYLWLPSPELAIRRIAQRVKKGGHNIPEADVRRRFTRSWTHLIRLYAPLADTWLVWDNRSKPPG